MQQHALLHTQHSLLHAKQIWAAACVFSPACKEALCTLITSACGTCSFKLILACGALHLIIHIRVCIDIHILSKYQCIYTGKDWAFENDYGSALLGYAMQWVKIVTLHLSRHRLDA